MDDSRARSAAGMTLVEVLVVLFIISVLAAFVTPVVWLARQKADKDLVRHELTRMALGVENFADQDARADWPPATLQELGIGGGNGLNEGIESLVACLAAGRGEGPYFDFDAERLTNLDGDEGPERVLKESLAVVFGDTQLREYVDLWGTPYVYFPSKAYGTKARYSTHDGGEFEACVIRDAASGLWPAPARFVIWSCGPDGINENGGGDDICSWR
ncbi:MAG TPA: type II secretion system protein [Planctomycetota bacterium]|nr:type II secretion system protein [Planctomycetota bacterium]NMD36690.1 type II secretion system protein [Planctomycetota bacterium]HNR99600.1 type II secretion system protein [Planctomycetota bacterium]HNU25657.1 type II secretion system protein [Planctomycetota bacterium]HOE29968.1 type II secretion system protein [Planctomycetota bacterium]